ncbi:PAT complex subunit CCDC47-like [Diadema setosum]|uniref:PAT complex subunit CCDC47-like n=1 Tax=Diadema setosum TaxID=31175 RepID=UPI003B3B2996
MHPRQLFIMAIVMGLVSLTVAARGSPHKAEIEDNEFAEFEDLDDDEEEEFMAVETEEEEEDGEFDDMAREDGDAMDRDEFLEDGDEMMEDEDEFDHFQDTEEFENFEERPAKGKGKESPDLEITKVPLHLRNSWDSYYLELLMLAGVAAYLLNYMNGKAKNQRLATAWLNCHKELLETNFSLVGDDGQKEMPTTVNLLKQSENRYCLWCSGRVFCEGMLVELKFLKRQDLLSVVSRTLHPASDEIKVTVTLDVDAMDSFILFLGSKKVANRMQKDMQDLSQYCGDKRGGEKYGLPPSTVVLAELGEVVNGVLDTKVLNCLNSHPEMFDYMHISDQFSGPKPSAEEEQPTKMPETQKVLICNFKVPGNGRCSKSDIEDMLPMMKMVIYLVDKIKRYRLSKEGKMKAERSRAKVAESFVKLAHAQRQELAQQRREDKRRAEKDRLLNEEDPDKARRLEDKQYKKEMRKRMNPNMKQIKVRGT